MCKVVLDGVVAVRYCVGMNIRYRDAALETLALQPGDGGWPPGLVNKYRERINQIAAADDERVFYALKSMHYEKLKGKRKKQHSMRLNDQWRLILEIEGTGADRVVWIIAIEDYH